MRKQAGTGFGIARHGAAVCRLLNLTRSVFETRHATICGVASSDRSDGAYDTADLEQHTQYVQTYQRFPQQQPNIISVIRRVERGEMLHEVVYR